MIIVAFLQNQWFKDPERMRKIRNNEHWKDRPDHEWNATWLFWGCLTGRRLKAVFGEELCSSIYWEETSNNIGGQSSSKFPASLVYMQSKIICHQPTHILAFGAIATNAMLQIVDVSPERTWALIYGPHPAARNADTISLLKQMKQELLE